MGWAELEVSESFSDHMVLQRGKPVPVWGWADAATKVQVEFGGQTKTASTTAAGRWKVMFKAMKANKMPQTMTVRSSGKIIKFSDVLVGDVWICSGQSNMGRAVKHSIRPENYSLEHPMNLEIPQC